jgi:hypothetical protein
MGRSGPAGRVDERGRIRRAARASDAVRDAGVPDRRRIRQASRRRQDPRRARSRAGGRAVGQSRGRERAHPPLARIRHRLAADVAHRRPRQRPAAASKRRRASVSRAAALRQPPARRAVRFLHGLQPRRALHRPRRRLSGRHVSRRLQRQLPHHAGAGPRGDQLRADSRHSHHPDRDIAAPAVVVQHPDVPGRRPRTVGGHDAGGRDHEPQDRHPRRDARSAAHRTVHAHRRRRHSVPGDVHRSRVVDGSVDRRARPQGAARRRRCVRVRLPRGESRRPGRPNGPNPDRVSGKFFLSAAPACVQLPDLGETTR